MTERTKITLDESEIPRQWYNMIPDLPAPPPPPLHPGTGQPVGPEDLAPLFPMELIRQEVATDPYIAIPDEVLDVYRLWRPTPLYRAHRLEKALNTPARIYYKYEGVSPAGSHKPNTAVPQAFYNAAEGTKRLTTETGAGQWGSALAFACAQYGIGCEIWMVRASYDQKPYRRTMMETWGAAVHPSPSRATKAGADVLAAAPGLAGQPGHRDQRGGRGGRRRPRDQVRARQRAQPRADAPDGDRRGGAQAVRRGRGVRTRPDRRLHRRRLQLRRAVLPVPAGEAGRPGQPGDPRGRAHGLPRRSPAGGTPTTSATPPGSPRC